MAVMRHWSCFCCCVTEINSLLSPVSDLFSLWICVRVSLVYLSWCFVSLCPWLSTSWLARPVNPVSDIRPEQGSVSALVSLQGCRRTLDLFMMTYLPSLILLCLSNRTIWRQKWIRSVPLFGSGKVELPSLWTTCTETLKVKAINRIHQMRGVSVFT